MTENGGSSSTSTSSTSLSSTVSSTITSHSTSTATSHSSASTSTRSSSSAPTGQPSPITSPYRRPSKYHNDNNNHPDNSGGANWGWILLAFLVVVLLIGSAWFIYAHWRARRLGVAGPRLNPFSDRNRVSDSYNRSGGLVGWVQEKIGAFRRQRTAGGAFEGTALDGVSGRRGRGMDPDEAWDTRVGTEADVYGGGAGGYYEEQELSGLHDGHNDSAYAGGGYGRSGVGYGPQGGLDEISAGEERGRKSELDARYDQEMGVTSHNPFEDHAEPSNMSLRGISPRPHAEDSPTERKSMFKENV